MSDFNVTVQWQRTSSDFKYETYNRQHTVRFNGGLQIANSSAPEFAGDASLPNPEELLASAIGSCFMLTFLAVSSKGGFTLDAYEDKPVATLEKNEKGKMAVTKVVLRPRPTFSGTKPDAAKLQEMYSKSHANCMISNSVSCQVSIEGQG